MIINNYDDLEIVSSIIPEFGHLLIETNSSGILYCIDRLDPTKLYKSIDKGENWDLIETRTYEIISCWHDQINDFLYFVGGSDSFKAGSQDFEVWYLDLSDDSIIEQGSYNDANGYIIVNDIFILNSALYITGTNYVAANDVRFGIWKWVDPNWVFQGGYSSHNSATVIQIRSSFILPIETTDIYYWEDRISGGNHTTKFINWNSAAGGTRTILNDFGINIYNPPPTKNQYGVAYDGSNIFYMILRKVAEGENYLVSYNITEANVEEQGIYNIALMLDRNTGSGIMEKAFHITEYKIYQLHSIIPYQLHLIAKPDSDAVFIGITDNFLMNNDGDIFTYIDQSEFIYNFSINYGYMKIPTAFMTAIDTFKITAGMFISISDTFTTAGSTSIEILFEGYVEPFIDQRFQEVILRSPATELLYITPEGDYSGRTDEIITSLLLDYAGYITKGTFSVGTELGQIHFNGDESLFQILNEFTLTDNFIWALTPTGQLYYNDGTVDSTINITETDNISQVIRRKGPRAINEVKIKGSIVAGDQAQGDGAQALEDQQLNGRSPFNRTISYLNTDVLCTTTENNILIRWGTQATLIDFIHYDPSVGVIQSGQTITFQNNKTDPNIGSAQFSIKNIIYDAKNQLVGYTIGDRIL